MPVQAKQSEAQKEEKIALNQNRLFHTCRRGNLSKSDRYLNRLRPDVKQFFEKSPLADRNTPGEGLCPPKRPRPHPVTPGEPK